MTVMTAASDLVIGDLSESTVELRERVASLDLDVAIYRELAQAALDQLVAANVQGQRLEHRIGDLIDRLRQANDDRRGLRAQLRLLEQAAA